MGLLKMQSYRETIPGLKIKGGRNAMPLTDKMTQVTKNHTNKTDRYNEVWLSLL